MESHSLLTLVWLEAYSKLCALSGKHLPEEWQQLFDTLRSNESLQPQLRRAHELARAGENISRETFPLLHSPLAGQENTKFRSGGIPCVSMRTDDGYFPLSSPAQSGINELVKAVHADLSSLAAGTNACTAGTLMHLLRQYAFCVPAGDSLPGDLSLYHYYHSVAAFAFCIAADETQTPGNEKFVLVSADLSGIQEFLYDLVSIRALRLLKGRSFYLQMLADSAQLLLLKNASAPACQVVYSSGGGFLLLLPEHAWNESFQNEIKNLQKSLLKIHSASLLLNVKHLNVSAEEWLQPGFGKIRERLFLRQNQDKIQKAEKEVLENPGELFRPSNKKKTGFLSPLKQWWDETTQIPFSSQ